MERAVPAAESPELLRRNPGSQTFGSRLVRSCRPAGARRPRQGEHGPPSGAVTGAQGIRTVGWIERSEPIVGLGRKTSRAASRVSGFARQHAEIDAELPQRLGVLAVVVVAEDELGVGGAVQPAVLLDLVLELARRPAGVAEREHRRGRAI